MIPRSHLGSGLRAAALATALLASCAGRALEPPSAPAPRVEHGLRVSLVWNEDVDLDLYLTDSSSESLYFGNNPTRWGARLETDVTCSTLAGRPHVETAYVSVPPPGLYRVGVDLIDACGSSTEAAPYRVAVDLGGQRYETTGTARFEVFDVIVTEFTIAAGSALRPE